MIRAKQKYMVLKIDIISGLLEILRQLGEDGFRMIQRFKEKYKAN